MRTIAVLWRLVFLLALSSPVTANDQVATQPERYHLFYENPIAVYGPQVRYDVFRNEKKIGQYTVKFDRGGDTLLVTAATELVVRYFGVPFYRYNFTAKEIWVDGKFVSVESEIRDNRKKPRVIKAQVRGRVLEVTDRGQSRLAPVVSFATTHWHPDALNSSRMFHTTHGRVRNVKVENLGTDRIALRDTSADAQSESRVVDTTRYKLSGGFAAELWYDKHDRWVRLQHRADDGSLIDYKCTNCNAF